MLPAGRAFKFSYLDTAWCRKALLVDLTADDRFSLQPGRESESCKMHYHSQLWGKRAPHLGTIVRAFLLRCKLILFMSAINKTSALQPTSKFIESLTFLLQQRSALFCS